jgi:uncharacterized protein
MVSDSILVFVRAPRLGGVKTRLAREVGDARALAVYRRLAEHTLAVAGRTGAAVCVHYAPAEGIDEVREWLGAGASYRPQAEGDLGARLEAAFDTAFARGARRVVVVGSDLPALTAGLLRHTRDVLERRGAVIGPAHDGGYYLLGLTAARPRLFRAMAWSTRHVFAGTRSRLRAEGVEPVLLPTLRDVDYAADLPDWGGWGR